MAAPAADARSSLLTSAEQLREAALDVLWRQWRALGGQAASRGSASAVVDPEALVLLSLTLMEHERRLADILHDWTVLNSDLLSVQRVKNLAAGYPPPTPQRLKWLAQVALGEGKDLRWSSLVRGSPGRRGAPPEPPSPRTGKGRAIRTRFQEGATLLLQLRLGLGVSVKADVLGFLLGTAGAWATVREATAATGYTVAAVRRAVEDMATARLVHATTGQPVAFRADPRAWGELLGLGDHPPPWRSWQQRFAFVAAFHTCVEDAQARPLSPYVLGVKGRELLERHRQAFDRDAVVHWSEHTPVPDWATFVRDGVHALAEWMIASA
jgi:hypothetical protein